MQTQIQARGFMLTQPLLATTEAQIAAFRARFPRLSPAVSVRLYDVNGVRGGPDKGCLACAQLGTRRIAVVASDVDADLYQAIASAFAKLTRATRTAVTRTRALGRKTLRRAMPRLSGSETR